MCVCVCKFKKERTHLWGEKDISCPLPQGEKNVLVDACLF